MSGWADITCGVPQGTKLGPILFTALVNRLCTDTELRAKFVDDLILLHLFRIDIRDRIAV